MALALVLFAAITFAGLVVGGPGSGARRLSGSCRWQVVGTRMMVAGTGALLTLAIAARILPQSAVDAFVVVAGIGTTAGVGVWLVASKIRKFEVGVTTSPMGALIAGGVASVAVWVLLFAWLVTAYQPASTGQANEASLIAFTSAVLTVPTVVAGSISAASGIWAWRLWRRGEFRLPGGQITA